MVQVQSLGQAPKLNEAQLMLLKLFSRQMPPDVLAQLRRLLVDFYDDVVQSEMERLIIIKGIDQEKLDALQHQHPKRLPYA